MRIINRFHQVPGFCCWVGLFSAFGGAYGYGTYGTYSTPSIGSSFPMEVVEPSMTFLTGMAMQEAPGPAAAVFAEDGIALKERMAAQRALRDKKASQLAKRRRKSAKAWRKEIELFLAKQRKIKSNAAATLSQRLKGAPALRPKAGPETQPLPRIIPSKPGAARIPAILA